MLVAKQKYPENYSYQEKLKSCVCSLTILSYPAFNSVFVATVASFVFKSEFFTRLDIFDLLTNYFSFIFALSMSFVNLS